MPALRAAFSLVQVEAAIFSSLKEAINSNIHSNYWSVITAVLTNVVPQWAHG